MGRMLGGDGFRGGPRLTAGAVAHNRVQVEPHQDRRGRIAYLESYDRRADLWVGDPGSGWPRQVTTEPRPRAPGAYGGGFLCWSPDGTALAFAGSDHQLWMIPDVGGPAERMTDVPGRCAAPAFDPRGRRVAFVWSTEERTDVVVAPVGGRPAREEDLVVLNRSDFAFDPDWAPGGELVAWQEWDVPNMPWDGSRVVVGRPDGSDRSVVDGGEHWAAQPRFDPEGRWLAYLSERTGWLNLWMADTSTWTPRHLVDEAAEHGPPNWAPRARSFAWSPDGERLMFVRSRQGRDSLAMVFLEGGGVEEVGGPSGALEDLVWGDRPVLVAGASTVPRSLVTLEGGRAVVMADDGLALWDGVTSRPAEIVTFPGEDGTELHGLLWRGGNGPSPLLLFCHGGPSGQVKDGWYPPFQYWVDRGYAVLAVNYRGSTGYGREYREALAGRWGELDVADAAAAARWAVGEGIAQAGRVVAWGGSAGGYLVLMLLALYGDRFAAGVNLFGVTDLLHLAEHTHRFEAHYLDHLVGPLPDTEPLYRDRSPIRLADRIRRPLLTLQGEDDEAVPPQQSTRIHEALRVGGVHSELALYPQEGHGFSKVQTLLDYLARMEGFLQRVLG